MLRTFSRERRGDSQTCDRYQSNRPRKREHQTQGQGDQEPKTKRVETLKQPLSLPKGMRLKQHLPLGVTKAVRSTCSSATGSCQRAEDVGDKYIECVLDGIQAELKAGHRPALLADDVAVEGMGR